MSDVLIEGMEMPKNHTVSIILTPNGYAYTGKKRLEIIEIPPHGALIDVDKIHWTGGTWESDFDYVIKKQINMMPTIIEAENGI